jgi:hypothetical protein
MKGFVSAEEGHVMMLYEPLTVSAAATSDTFLMEAWQHASIVCLFGAGSGCSITVGECTSFAGSDRTAISFRYAIEATSGGDVLDAALALASTITIAAGSACYAVIELDADELTDGYPYVQVNLSDPGTAKLACIMAVLSGGRFTEDITVTAIA